MKKYTGSKNSGWRYKHERIGDSDFSIDIPEDSKFGPFKTGYLFQYNEEDIILKIGIFPKMIIEFDAQDSFLKNALEIIAGNIVTQDNLRAQAIINHKPGDEIKSRLFSFKKKLVTTSRKLNMVYMNFKGTNSYEQYPCHIEYGFLFTPKGIVYVSMYDPSGEKISKVIEQIASSITCTEDLHYQYTADEYIKKHNITERNMFPLPLPFQIIPF